MNLEQIKSLVENQESSMLEFKATTAHLRAAFATACAFLNSKGGTVLIGVKDSGKIVGQDVSDGTCKEIASETNKIEPASQGHLKVDYIPLEDKKYVIAINVKPGDHAPYVYDGRPYQRDESSTNKMSQQRYDQLVSKRNQLNFSWENFVAEGYDLDLLDQNLILSVVRKGVEEKRLPEIALRQDTLKVLERLDLVNKENKLTNAAVVLFGTKFMPHYPQCHLKMARFKGTTRHEFLDSDLVYGNAFDLLEQGMSFVKKHLPVAAKIEPGKLERVETPIIPFDAIREALINAICHRDYNIYQGTMGLAIYDDRMELFNNGGLLQDATLERIKAGFSLLRNPNIANAFYRCKLIERWGRGIGEIINRCKVAGDPEPEFIVDPVEFKVVFKFPFSLKPAVIPIGEGVIKTSSRQQEIIELLTKSKELTTKEIMDRLKEPLSDRTLRRDLVALKKFGIVASRGRTHKAVWFLLNKG